VSLAKDFLIPIGLGILAFFFSFTVLRRGSRTSSVVAILVGVGLAVGEAYVSVTTGMGLGEHVLCNLRPATKGCGGEIRMVPVSDEDAAVRRLRRHLDDHPPNALTSGDIAKRVDAAVSSSTPQALLRLAATGDFRAEELVAAGYERGIAGFPRDRDKAADFFTRAVEGGSATAPYHAALFFQSYKMHFGKARNDRQVTDLLQVGAMRGDGSAMVELGDYFINARYSLERDVPHGIELLETAERRGDPSASFFLGRLYHEGRHVTRDDAKADLYWRTARSRGWTWFPAGP
jgi:hypothetical protein